MAKHDERIARLEVYAANLKTRLTSPVPDKHKNSPESFKQMIETDLRKTLATIDKLKIG
jgi:hypothetical protein